MTVIDSWGQFAKLFPSYSRNINLTKAQQLDLVQDSLVSERSLSDRGHWAYCLNRHLALVELRDALMAECGVREHEAAA